MYWPFYDSGFTITGAKKILYQAGQNITFNCVYLTALGVERTVTWNFYNSKTFALIKSGSGITHNNSFTLAQGKDGVDVEMILDFGLHRTIFKKRHRFIIIPDITTPTRLIDISTIPIVSGNGVAFTNSATATVTGGVATVTTSAAHGVAVGETVVLTQSSIQRTYKAQTGTTGTTLILDRPWEGTNGTIPNSGTRKGNSIQHQLNASTWSPGDIVHFTGKLYTARCRFINMNGTDGNEIYIVNPNDSSTCEFIATRVQDDVFQFNENCNHIRVCGDINGSNTYRFTLTDGGLSAQHLNGGGNVTNCNNIRLLQLRVHNAKSTGIKPKLDAVNRTVGCFDDCWVAGCRITDSGNEGIYMGYFRYNYDPSFNGGDYHHAMNRAKCFANHVTGSKWDNIQMSGSHLEAEFHHNFMKDAAQAIPVVGGQNFGAVMNGGWKGDFYNNININNTTQCIPYSDTRVYSNIGYNTTYGNAFFCRRADNANLGSPVYNPYDVNAKLQMWGNIWVSSEDSIYLLDINDDGGTLAPMARIYITNNFLGYTGSIVEGFIRYNEPASGQTRVVSPNIQVSGATNVQNAIQFNDLSTEDTRLKSTSSVFLSSNAGIDISAEVNVNDLPTRMFTDLYDQIMPERGIWLQSPYSESTNHEAELVAYTGRTQLQWYQTAQLDNSLGYSDKVKIPRFFGGEIEEITYISNSDKPRYIYSGKAYPNIGNPDIERFVTPSLE